VGYISYFHTIIVKNLVPMMKANDVLRYTKKNSIITCRIKSKLLIDILAVRCCCKSGMLDMDR